MKSCPRCQSIYPDSYAVCPQDNATLLELGTWADGAVIRGKFRVVRKIGQGGMGAVYEALHLRFNERRALKVMSPEVASEPEFVKRFEREAIVTRRLHHPNAVRVDDIEEAEDGRPYIVMEYVEGPSLKHLMREAGSLPVPRVCAIIRQVASALEAAHQLSMVHRDIKPDNIVLVPAPGGEQAKVLDFGIAKLQEARATETHLTATGVVLGTPQYMSPEQALGKRGDELDGRSDIYSLGVVMYEMLTGALPFKADTTVGLLHAHAFEPPRPIPEVRPDLDLPAPINNLVMRCLAKNRADRPATALALIGELDRVAPSAESKPSAATHGPDKPAPTSPTLPASSSAVSDTWMRRWSGGWRFLVLLGFYLLVVDTASFLLSGKLTSLAIVTPIMGILAGGGWYVAARKRGLSRWVGFAGLILAAGLTAMLFQFATPEIKHRLTSQSIPTMTPAVRTLRGHTGIVNSLAFSPDSKLLASASADDTVRLWDVRTGALQRTLTEPASLAYAVVFSPDGQTLVSSDQSVDNSIRIWDVNTGKLRKSFRPVYAVAALAISPDGTLLAAGGRNTNGHSERNLELWELPSGKSRGMLRGHTDAISSLAFSADGSVLASGSRDGTVKLWDAQSGALKQTLPNASVTHETPRVAFSLQGALLAITGLDNHGVRLLDVTSGAQRTVGEEYWYLAAFSPDGKTLALAGAVDYFDLLDVASGAVQRRLKGPVDYINSLVYSPDGKLLASDETVWKKDPQGHRLEEVEAGLVNLWLLE